MGFNLTPVVKNILLINIIIFGAGYLLNLHPTFIHLFGLRYIGAESFYIHQFVTHIFMHANFNHLFMNMIGVLVFGPLLEQFWGSKRFLIFYMVAGLGAGIFYSAINFYETYSMDRDTASYVSNPTPENFARYSREYEDMVGYDHQFIRAFAENPENPEYINESVQYLEKANESKKNIPMVGASGALFGILMAFGLLFPNTELFLLFPPIPIKAKYLVAFYGLTAIFSAIHNVPGDNVAHYAHLGGMLFGWIMVMVWKKERDRFY